MQTLIQTLQEWMHQLYGTFIVDENYMLLVEGFKNTFIITFGALLIGIGVGTTVAAVKFLAAENRALKPLVKLCDFYVTAIRGIPIVVLLLICYFVVMKTSTGMVTCIVAFGIASRVAKSAINEARKNGIKAGMIRPITLWPFPEKALSRAADTCKAFISVELNMGQMIDDVRLATGCRRPVTLCNRAGGIIPNPAQVYEHIVKVNEKIGGAM